MAISLWSADISLMRFKSRAEARDWCKEHYPGSPVREIGPRSGRKSSGMTLSPDDPLAKPRKKAPGGKK
jgi:hypothetical protein